MLLLPVQNTIFTYIFINGVDSRSVWIWMSLLPTWLLHLFTFNLRVFV